MRASIESIYGTSDPPELKRLIATADFPAAVRANSQYQDGSTYDPVHDYGTAKAVTLPIIDDQNLKFVIILDARQLGPILPFDASMYLYSTGTIMHELKHALDYAWRSRVDGNSWIFTIPNRTKEILMHNTWVIASEYSCERFVGDLISGVARGIGGTVSFTATMGHLTGLESMLTGLREYLRQNIARFRVRALDVRGILASNCQRVLSILILSTYGSSVGESSPEVRVRLDSIEQLPDFQRFFSPGWSSVHGLLKRYYDEDHFSRAKPYLEQISTEVGQILERCGLQMSDRGEALWLEVLDV